MKNLFQTEYRIAAVYSLAALHAGGRIFHQRKLLYGLLLNRTMLSQKSGWVSEDGNVYVIYTIKQMANDLDRSERTVKTALRELENAGLITRVRQGWNQANRIFLQIPDRVQLSSRPEGNICPMDVQDSSPCMGQKLPTSNTDDRI